jgi:HlyD family secretion protein
MDKQPLSETLKRTKRKRKSRKWVIFSLVLVSIAFALWFFLLRPAGETTVVVRYAAVERGDIVKAITATGQLQATKTVQVGSQISGAIMQLYADFNSRVTKGQLIAVIDPTFYEASVKEAMANNARATAEVENAEREVARADELFKRALISKAEYEAATTKLRTATAAQAQTAAALARARVNLGYTRIHAPISGTVISRNVDVGQTVAASLNAPTLFVIAEDLSNMEVQANVDEADIGQVSDDQEVDFTVDAFAEKRFKGKVKMVRISPTVQQNVVTYTVVIGADNSEGMLLPGMTATVTITSEERRNVLRIPTSALKFTPSTGDEDKKPKAPRGKPAEVVYRKAGDKEKQFEPLPLTTGLSDGMFTEIKSGSLKEGDSVAIGMMAVGGQPGNRSTNPLGNQMPGGGRGMRRSF